MNITLKPILPKGGHLFPDAAAILAGLDDGLVSASIKVQSRFESTADTFEEIPTFLISMIRYGQEYHVFTEDENYSRISEGTPSHVIEAAPGKVLAFPSTFTAKTKPGRLKAGAGAIGEEIIFRHRVFVRGIEPRLFDVLVSTKEQNTVAKEVQKALNKAIKK
jgi:hypothetical protein